MRQGEIRLLMFENIFCKYAVRECATGELAQMVEHPLSVRKAVGSIPTFSTAFHAFIFFHVA